METKLARLIKLHGTLSPFPRNRILQAGSLTMNYEKGNIRYISTGGTEIIRMIYAAVRDEEWHTVQPVIRHEKIIRAGDAVLLRFEARYCYKDIDFKASFALSVTSDNRVTFEMNGRALSTFKKNRIGFCVLHPILTCAGKKCIITHPDGTKSMGEFPRAISPYQPFANISAMQWEINDQASVLLRFSGDLFETEDQRNWTDASFKTYSTPLDIPYPVEIKEGTTIDQKVELEIVGTLPKRNRLHRKTIFQCFTDHPEPLPDIGLGVSSRPQPLTFSESTHLKTIGFSHLRSELHLFDSNFDSQYRRMSHESSLLNLPVELCLIFGKDPAADIRSFLQHYSRNPVKLKSVLLYSRSEKATPREIVEIVAPELRRELKGIPIGSGTNCNFAQLNRAGLDPALVDFIAFAIHPQEHASDDQTLFENMMAQKDTVDSARILGGQKPVHVSPVTLQRRFNANISNYEIPAVNQILPPQLDVRQFSLAGAAWTIGSLKYLLESGIRAVTYYETVGERGLMMGDHDSQWPVHFPAEKGMFFPVYHVFRLLLRQPECQVLHSVSSHPHLVDGFAVSRVNQGLIFLANMSCDPQTPEMKGIREWRTLFTMNSRNYNRITQSGALPSGPNHAKLAAANGPLYLQPYECRVLQFIPEQ